MIGLLIRGAIGLGVPQKLAKPLVIGIGILLIAFAAWRMVDSYGDRRERDGVEKTDAKWIEASNKLKEAAAQSATKADDKAAERLDEFKAQADADAAAVEQAKAEGKSPLDALFGG